MAEDWMPGAKKVVTAATSARTSEPEGIVFHVIQGYMSTMLDWAAERPKAVHQSSYHFGIDKAGGLIQFCPISQRAWHSGRVPDPVAAAALWSLYRPGINPNDYTVGIAAEGMSETAWNDAQHATAIDILRWLESEWMDVNDETVIGHRDLDPVSRKHDPGENWDKAWLLAHVVPPEESSDLNNELQATKSNLPPRLEPFDSPSWAEAWSRGATPVRYAGSDEVHEIRITRRT
jgi:N-acetyl-anhydromuramyl-L-alanine amidase AmpD